MKKTFKNLNDLFEYINEQKQSALKSDVAEIAVETMRDKVQTEVYDVYDPVMYKRTGGLQKEIDVGVIDDDTIYIENVRVDRFKNEYGIEFENDVAEIVETGIGYEYPFPYMGVPRPFTQATREELAKGKAKDAMKKGLKKRGIDSV